MGKSIARAGAAADNGRAAMHPARRRADPRMN